MSRTRAEALALVNWKGVFYQRYLLDRHVTALEGANGAGKTTVMIAAYVVLLPDMSRLRFTNLGETGATGGDKGIWGRLGEPGRPSYAVIDFDSPSAGRLIAGVHLERKGEPSVEPTPFLVTGLAPDVRLQDLLLVAQGDEEAVPELPELRENAARLGGRLQVFSSVRDYFAALFEADVIPLRLGTDEERNKLNEMLRTSMTGGISRALTSELRSFLLKEEGGLADTLQRMKANLDACRRTRTEVQESQRLEREIGGVFEAGQTMFAAAFAFVRERADEYQRRLTEAEALLAAAEQVFREAGEAYEGAVRDAAEAQRQQVAEEQALAAARNRQGKMAVALEAAVDRKRCRHELEAAEEQEKLAERDKTKADEDRGARREDLRRAQETYRLAASGLADLQRGLEELHRRAYLFTQVTRRHAEAESLLGKSLPVPGLPAAATHELATSRQRLTEVDQQRRDAARRLADAEKHREEHQRILDALRVLAGEVASHEQAHSIALFELRRLRELRLLEARIPELTQLLDEKRRLAGLQAAAQGRARQLALVLGEGSASGLVQSRLELAEAEKSSNENAERVAQARLQDLSRQVVSLKAQSRELKEREPVWRALAAQARRLEDAVLFPVADRTSLDRAREELANELTATRTRENELVAKRERLLAEARELLAAGGPFEPDLLRLKDDLAADLVAESFEEVGLEESARLEARLGPLVQALVVDDPEAAAREIVARPASLASVWLLGRDREWLPAEGFWSAAATTATSDVWVGEGPALRVTRVPERPRLGRRAREQRAAELQQQAAAIETELMEVRSSRRSQERLQTDGEALLAELNIWLAGDPSAELAELQRRLLEAEVQTELLRKLAERHAEAAREMLPRIKDLRALLPEAYLLDLPDQAERAAAVAEEYRSALAARVEVARCAEPAIQVEDGIEVLRRPPLSAVEIERLLARVAELEEERDRLDAAIEAIDFTLRHHEAFAWEEAPVRLRQEKDLVPALQHQLELAEAGQNRSEAAWGTAEAAYEAILALWQKRNGRRIACFEKWSLADTHFREQGIAEPTEEALAAIRAEVFRLEKRLEELGRSFGELARELGRREATRKQAEEKRAEAETKLTSERREAEPAFERWEKLRQRAAEHGILAGLPVAAQGGGSVNWVQEAHAQAVRLLERLSSAQGGKTLLAEFEKKADGDLAFADICLENWLKVRDWLRRRLPAQVAEVDDPREALFRLRDQLAALEERLSGQEKVLRGASEDGARGIDVQVRKARGQVTRLNRNLEGVRFGSIGGIRVRLQPVERMEQVLRALRQGEVQALLFQADLPIEEALDEIFRRFGGGRTGGQRLLDYREYLHLQVEIRRSSGTDWEVANPTRLSTGEAIGVGAALMMVVLTEWERDANLLRGKRGAGSLRFLFLDEANRLSHDNLGVLFDLCRALDLQLLIAAPEVARAEGNTTYRLVRRVTAEGREDVVVSGRRVSA